MNILVNRTDFNQAWAANDLIEWIKSDSKVYIMALKREDGYSQDYSNYHEDFSNTSDFRYDLKRPFISYGIKDENISFFNQYYDYEDDVYRKLKTSDIVLLACDDVEDGMNVLEDHGLVSMLRNFNGIIIGAAGGAKLLMDQFYYEDTYEGLIARNGIGRIKGYDVDVHYVEDESHLSYQIHTLEQNDVQLIVLPQIGGAIVNQGRVELLGGAFIVKDTDLDELYELHLRQNDTSDYL